MHAWREQRGLSQDAVALASRVSKPFVGQIESDKRAGTIATLKKPAFVAPNLVRGTLVMGSKLLPSIPPGMARALFSMFLVAEVHPFIDGNGRLARLVMNAELTAMDECRIIIPTLYREQYLDCLRRLTRDGDPGPFLKAMTYIQEWTAGFDYDVLDTVIDRMKACNAFERSLNHHKLLMPK